MTDAVLRQLAELDPVDQERLPHPESRQAELLLARVLSEPAAPRRPARRSRLWRLVPAVALLALGAVWLLARPADNPDGLSCYREAALGADQAIIHADLEQVHPAAACQREWEAGRLWDDPPPPALTACVTDRMVIAVIPGEAQACWELGWAPLDLSGTSLEIMRVSASVRERFEGGLCPTASEARMIAEDILADLDLARQWEVRVAAPGDREGPCTSIAVDGPERTLLLVPLPRVDGG